MQSRRNFIKQTALITAGSITLGASTLNANSNSGAKMKTEPIANLTPKAKENFMAFLKTTDLPVGYSDPEFISNYINFAFDESLEKSGIDHQSAVLLIMVSLVASGGENEFEHMVNAGLNLQIDPSVLKETLYHTTPYVGVGKMAQFIRVLNLVFAKRGVELKQSGSQTTTRQNRHEKGLQAQIDIFGEGMKKYKSTFAPDMAHFADFLSANCFGDYYTRTGLNLSFRELLTFAILASLGGVESQLKGHITGNLNMQNDRAKLIAVITLLVPYIGYPRSLNALNAINEITPYKEEK
ncbi:carboxymuconolactone decarboxylase family protein [Campylobacter iguaniorum]|uniref:Carboxymuconolactone decarboxylase family protein n=1 Tax=Campylobacter iguaniorum TaxID=1244531 RepID=A0A076FDL2_9BACT|nr:carboxymuconolactone decarboxylase family protein [Campylobacter iguaniorum]AII15477.1 carboxymuconolactone decarboxylase family protein [Campylobacter iguaniorum]